MGNTATTASFRQSKYDQTEFPHSPANTPHTPRIPPPRSLLNPTLCHTPFTRIPLSRYRHVECLRCQKPLLTPRQE